MEDFGYYDYATPYGYGSGMEYIPNEIAQLLGGALVTVMSCLLIYLLIVWVFRSLGLYQLAKDRGIAHAWFSWIPILYYYIIGRLINNKVVLGDDWVLPRAEFFLPFLTLIASATATFGGYWGAIISVAIWVYQVSALWRLFKIYDPNRRAAFTIWSVILGSGFFIYAIRNNRPFDPLDPQREYKNYNAQTAAAVHTDVPAHTSAKASDEALAVRVQDKAEAHTDTAAPAEHKAVTLDKAVQDENAAPKDDLSQK